MDNREKILNELYIIDEALCNLDCMMGMETEEIAWYDNIFIEIRSQIDNLEKILYPEPEYNNLWDEKLAGLQLENAIKIYL